MFLFFWAHLGGIITLARALISGEVVGVFPYKSERAEGRFVMANAMIQKHPPLRSEYSLEKRKTPLATGSTGLLGGDLNNEDSEIGCEDEGGTSGCFRCERARSLLVGLC